MSIELIRQVQEYKFDFNLLRKDTLDILSRFNIPQIGLTHTPNVSSEEKIIESVGSLYDIKTKKFKYRETDFSIFNEEFKNTYLYEMYRTIPNIGRFRIMVLDGPTCYTIHRDQTLRYHYVIETNPDCLFLFPDQEKQIHIPADGNLYILDTRYRHTFVNGSRQRRIHLVLDDLSKIRK